MRVVGKMLSKDRQAQIICLVCAFITFTSSTIWLRNPNEKGPTAVNAGNECLRIVSKYYFYNQRVTRTENLGFFHSNKLSAPSSDIELRFLVDIHHMIANDIIDGLQLRVVSDGLSIDGLINIDPQSVMLTDYYVVVADDFSKFLLNMNNFIIKSSAWNPGAKFLILFNNPDQRQVGCSGTAIASKFFQLMYNKFNALNVVILYATGVKTYDVYVTNPYKDENDCKSLKPIVIDICDNGKLKRGKLTMLTLRSTKVPEKVPLCTFTFCAMQNEPYINEECTTGLEINIMLILQDVMKFKTKTICSNMTRGEPENGSWTGLLGLLRNDKCDFIVGGFFPDNDVHEDFGVTTTYLEDTYTWYVYFAPLRDPWKGLIEIFEPQTWLLLIIVLFVAGISWFIFGIAMVESKPHSSFVLCVMNSLAVFLGISSNNRPNFTPLRVFFVILALYGLNITTIYTSNLISVFTNPAHDQQISTIDEIIKTGMPIGGREEYIDWFRNDNPLDAVIAKKYNTSERFKPTLENMNLVRDGYISILANRIYVLSHDLEGDVFGIPGNVFSNPIEMISERGFPLIRKFNSLINRMKDAGLVTKIYNDFLFDMTILDHIRTRGCTNQENQIVLTVQHLQGAFAVLILGLIISFVVFVIEIILNSKWFQHWWRKITKLIIEVWDGILIKLKLKENREENPLKLRKKFK